MPSSVQDQPRMTHYLKCWRSQARRFHAQLEPRIPLLVFRCTNHHPVAAHGRATAETSRVRHYALAWVTKTMPSWSAIDRTLVELRDWLIELSFPRFHPTRYLRFGGDAVYRSGICHQSRLGNLFKVCYAPEWNRKEKKFQGI